MAYSTIDDSSLYFQNTAYTGNGSGRSVTFDGNSDLQPDWLWIKQRNATKNHNLWDTNRGITKALRANLTNAEATNTAGDNLASLDSDGFTLGDDTDSVGVNENSQTYGAWAWKCNGGTTSTNSDGTVNTTMQLNATAGFSIITWTGNGSNTGTVGHGLGAIPDCIIEKAREADQNWSVAFPKFETSKLLALNLDSSFFSASGMSSYNTSTFVDGSGSASEDYIAYCFKNIKGYSRFGFFVGTGDANGPMVYTGFEPNFVIIKESGANTNDWFMYDGMRDYQGNGIDKILKANTNAAESTGRADIDLLSNGFKMRATHADTNRDGGAFVYLAFAKHPWVTSDGTVNTAVV